MAVELLRILGAEQKFLIGDGRPAGLSLLPSAVTTFGTAADCVGRMMQCGDFRLCDRIVYDSSICSEKRYVTCIYNREAAQDR